MLIEEKIDLVMNNMNIKHYRSLGFITKMGDTIEITTSQLSKGAHNKVKIKCDYCGEVFERVYKDYLKFKGKVVDLDTCKDCRPVKTKQNNLANYGVESIRHVKEVNEKIEATNINRYGVRNPFESAQIREKGIQTTIDNHGVDNYFKVDNFHSIQEKSMLEKYGYKHYSEDPIKSNSASRKRNETMYSKGNAPSSRQQNYIHDVVSGELNYPVGVLMLDIAFPDEKIYLEFQGSGHDLDVKMGKATAEEFKKKEINRYYFLKKQGWKMIEIISTNDLLPYPKKIEEMIELSKEVCKESSYIVFNLDDSTVKIKGAFIDYSFGKVITQGEFRKIHENGLYKDFMKSIL